MYIMGCFVEVAVPGTPGPGVAPPAGVPISAMASQLTECKGQLLHFAHA